MNHNRESRFGLYVSMINRAAQGYFHHKLKNYDIGPGQQAYLLSLFPGESIVQEELAKRLKVDKANVTRALKGLEDKGYIARNRSDGDKRSWIVTLTESGISTREEIEEISREWIEVLKKPLTDNEWVAIESSLRIIAESLNGEGN
ncbi:MAG: MarR family transcriptional regulator [Spirochaetaceae bacterium]|jgi:DNA-binding MarR family transcriptional regulator|nr:MarR family transcriptional regulator [Spirochaetaceae bacterium]